MSCFKKIVPETLKESDPFSIKVHAIPSNPIKKHVEPIDDDFLEFRRIYGHLFNKNFGKKPYYRYERAQFRPRIEVKTIQLEMPIMGAEQAVIKPNKAIPKTHSSPKPQKKIEKKLHQPSSTTSYELKRKLSHAESSLSKDSKIRIHQTTSTFLDITNRELEVANEKLRHFKELLERKQIQAETQTLSEPKPKKNTRLSSISTLRKKLKDLEKQFYKRPQVVYKSVKERFTQSSLETLYKNQTFFPDKKFDQTLDEAISELQDIVDVKITEEFSESGNSETLKDTKITLDKPNNNLLKSLNFPDASVPVDKYKLYSKDTQPIHSKDISLTSDDTLANFSCSNLGVENKNVSTIETKKNAWINNYAINKPGGDQKEMETEQSFSKTVRFDLDQQMKDLNSGAKKYNWLDPKKSYMVENNHELGDIGDIDKTDQFERSPQRNSFKIVLDDFQNNNTDNISQLIDLSERKLKKFTDLKRDIVDINGFCDELCTITKSDDEDEDELNHKKELSELKARMIEDSSMIQLNEIKHDVNEETIENKNVFDDTNLQNCVMKSSYLMKEFNIQPKIFTEKQDAFADKRKFYQIANKCKDSKAGGVKNLLDSLEFALENSIYTVSQ